MTAGVSEVGAIENGGSIEKRFSVFLDGFEFAEKFRKNPELGVHVSLAVEAAQDSSFFCFVRRG